MRSQNRPNFLPSRLRRSRYGHSYKTVDQFKIYRSWASFRLLIFSFRKVLAAKHTVVPVPILITCFLDDLACGVAWEAPLGTGHRWIVPLFRMATFIASGFLKREHTSWSKTPVTVSLLPKRPQTDLLSFRIFCVGAVLPQTRIAWDHLELMTACNFMFLKLMDPSHPSSTSLPPEAHTMPSKSFRCCITLSTTSYSFIP